MPWSPLSEGLPAETEERGRSHGKNGSGPSRVILRVERKQKGKRRFSERCEPGSFGIPVRLSLPTSSSADQSSHLLQPGWAQEGGFLRLSMNDENDEKERVSVSERCINVNKTPQKHVTRVDPDTLLRKILKRIVGGRLCHETSGGRPRGQSLEQKRPEINELGHRPAPDIGVTGSWTSGSWDLEPAGLNPGKDGQRDLEAG